MTSSASSLHFLSLTPQSLYSSKPNTPFSFHFSPSALNLTNLSISASHSSIRSRFVRNVAVSSEFDVAEEEEEDALFDSSEEDGEERRFSPDLKIFVGNLPFSADSSALAGLFGRAGNVEMVEVIYDKETGRSRGFAFVTMASVEEVEAAVQQFNGYELDGRPLRVNSGPAPPKRDNFASRDFSSRGGPRGSSGFNNSSRDYNSGSRGSPRGSSGFNNSSRDFNSGNRVYVGNLSWGVDDGALENMFRGHGKVTEARVVYDRDSGRSRGFGFVTFSSAQEVNSAVEALDGAELDGRTIRVNPAEERQRRQF